MIRDNLKIVREKIEKKCIESGRNPSDVKLIAVSKNFGIDDIKRAFDEGIHDFGENRAQELDKKVEQFPGKVNWHFIGNLQRNKVRFAVHSSEYIHSADSLLLVSEINKHAGKNNKVQKILLQVKTSFEETKSGITEYSELSDLAFYCRDFPYVDLRGLMTIAPLTDDENSIRKSFVTLRKMRDKLKSEGLNLSELSMGMSSDFELAVEEGATMLRIGSAIFGERDYSTDWKEKL